MGEVIDTYTVCRLKAFKRFHNKADYGDRTDYVCATDSIMSGAVKCAPDAKPWVYYKYGSPKVKVKLPHDDFIEVTNKWNAWFQKRCGYIGQGAKGRNYSIGTAAAVIAMENGFRQVVFAGCDTLMNPELKYESVYNPKTVHCAHHIWAIENEMIHICAEQKGVELCELSLHGVTKASRYTDESSSRLGICG